jgi:hypothetical protein
MCYDYKTSIQALTINVISSIILYNSIPTNVQLKTIALFSLFVGVMQLWDALFWIYPEQTTVNQYATKAAMIWNHLEPIVLGLLIMYVMGKSLPSLSKYIFTLYIIFSIIYTVSGWFQIKGTTTTIESKDSLNWQWNHLQFAEMFYILFLLCLIILFYENFTGWISGLSILLTIFTFAFSYYKYDIKKSTGRFWCYFAAFTPLFYLIYMNLCLKI